MAGLSGTRGRGGEDKDHPLKGGYAFLILPISYVGLGGGTEPVCGNYCKRGDT